VSRARVAPYSTGVLLFVVGCGPSVSPPSGDHSTTGEERTTTAGSTGSSGGRPSATEILSTTGPAPDPTSATTVGPGTGQVAESSGGPPPPCVCGSQPVDISEDINGATPAEALALFGSAAFELNWWALADDVPSTATTLTLSYADGPVLLKTLGDEGCDGEPMQCPTGLEISVLAQLATADGILDGTFEATLVLDESWERSQSAALLTGPLALQEFGGTLAAEPFLGDRGEATSLASARYRARWNADGLEFSDLAGDETTGRLILIGSTL